MSMGPAKAQLAVLKPFAGCGSTRRADTVAP
jgi:hypothetical protein